MSKMKYVNLLLWCAYILLLLLLLQFVTVHLPPQVLLVQHQYIPSINTGTMLLVLRAERASAFDRRHFEPFSRKTPRGAIRGVLYTAAVLTANPFCFVLFRMHVLYNARTFTAVHPFDAVRLLLCGLGSPLTDWPSLRRSRLARNRRRASARRG